MLYDKIEHEGGLSLISSKTLVGICKALRDIIATQADLVQHIPYIRGMQAQVMTNNTQGQLKILEAQIIESIPDPILKSKYEQIRLEELKKEEEEYNRDLTDGYINLSEYPEDTYIV